MRPQRSVFLTVLALIWVLAGCAAQPSLNTKDGAKDSAKNATSADNWVAVWGASPVVPGPNGPAIDNQTLRLIVHPTLTGDQVRVRIGNTFGARALDIGGASIALQESGATLVPGSRRALTFSGRGVISIPPGALLVSDPVALSPGQRNLAISIYLPKNSGPATAHPGANQTSYISAGGDFVADDDAAVFGTAVTSWPFLASIEARTSKRAHTVVTFGDSITDGFKSTINANHRWPDFLSARLLAAGRTVAVVNQGISGNRLLHDASSVRPVFGPNGLSRFDRDALTVTGVTHVVVLLGINDIGMGDVTRNPDEAITADNLIAGYRQLALRAHARGLKIIGATLTPFGQAAYFSERGEQIRQTVNGWIRSNKEFDGVIDFDLAVRNPGKPVELLPAYDSGDHLHPSDGGYEAMAKSIDLGVFD